MKTEIFLREDLDDPNHPDAAGEIGRNVQIVNPLPSIRGPADTERHKLTGGQRLPGKSGVFVGENCRGRVGVRIHGARDDRALRHRAGRSLPPAFGAPPQRFLTAALCGRDVGRYRPLGIGQ